ncbi:hypothetical protein CK485_02520 [Streptomyces sp. ICBB 8177]|nr:hypothetical protein CK485_02520 [Streptomyces sp. ICBB 8177]
MRGEGKTYDEIVEALGVSRSSVSLWVRDLAPPARPRRKPDWGPYRERTRLAREEAKAAARAEVGCLTDRELFIAGVALYWAEGSKSKPYRIDESVIFVNSDPDVIEVYLAWLQLLGVDPGRLRFRLMIHESADVAAAERYWAELVGDGSAAFGKTTLKRHNPATVRKSVGEGYRGCLAVKVLNGADLYRRIEGWWCGIVGVGKRRQRESPA